MSSKTFENLDCWKKSIEFCKIVYSLTKRGEFKKDFDLVHQIRRAAISIPSNIAEGFERGSVAEQIHFLYIAKGSAGEVRTQLHLSHELKYISSDDYNKINNNILEISRMIFGLIEYLKKSKIKGDKHIKLGT